MSEITDADRLRAEGAEIELKDGRKVRLKFDWDGIAHLEKIYGSVDAWTREFDGDLKTRGTTALRDGLVAGLIHLGFNGDAKALLPFDRRRELRPAVMDAWSEAWPARDEADEDEEDDEGKAPGDGSSPGTTTTSSPPSRSIGRRSSSGA